MDFSFLAGDGNTGVQCHKAIIVATSPFLLAMVKESDADQIILPDFSIEEIAILMNLSYTGKYEFYTIINLRCREEFYSRARWGLNFVE